MNSQTKNKKSREQLDAMFALAFPGERCKEWTELSEGCFNVAYLARSETGRQSVLKIAPSAQMTVMSYEKNIMESEVRAMEMASRDEEIPVARVYYYDDSRSLCDAPYFFMEKLPGRSVGSLGDTLTREERRRIDRRVGELNRRINRIQAPAFGLPGQPAYQGTEWYPVFRRMVELGVSDAAARDIDLKISTGELFEKLEKDQEIFQEVRIPRLLHWDLWEGNVFVENGEVTGLIDWERSLWADPLMEVGFRTYKDTSAFMEGYGIGQLSEREARRALWYDVYLTLLVSLEYEYRHYDTTEMYDWAVGLLARQLGKL